MHTQETNPRTSLRRSAVPTHRDGNLNFTIQNSMFDIRYSHSLLRPLHPPNQTRVNPPNPQYAIRNTQNLLPPIEQAPSVNQNNDNNFRTFSTAPLALVFPKFSYELWPKFGLLALLSHISGLCFI